MEKIANDIKQNHSIVITPEELQAKFVGRWPDGTPLVASPDHPDSSISGDFLQDNNFKYDDISDPTPVAMPTENVSVPSVADDRLGKNCPFFAHIRKVNPRDGTTEEGREKTLGKQILRRGINFGPSFEEAPEAERGLIFMSYQTSIEEQFEFLQRNWANSSQKPHPLGHDFIIGQSANPDNRRIAKLDLKSKTINVTTLGSWVTTTGGGYFFTPSISTIRGMIKKIPPDP